MDRFNAVSMDILMAALMRMPCARQRARSCNTCCAMAKNSRSDRPAASMAGTNRAGPIMPPDSTGQRASASALTVLPLRMSTLGWYQGTNSPAVRACIRRWGVNASSTRCALSASARGWRRASMSPRRSVEQGLLRTPSKSSLWACARPAALCRISSVMPDSKMKAAPNPRIARWRISTSPSMPGMDRSLMMTTMLEPCCANAASASSPPLARMTSSQPSAFSCTPNSCS